MGSDVHRFFDVAESKLDVALSGKTLLGEMIFTRDNCDEFAGNIRKIVEWTKPRHALRLMEEQWSLCLSVWLVNEAYFNFTSGTYWPYVLEKIGITQVNQYSSAFGKVFLALLRRRRLPEFRQLKTRWSYLGPILAHCGIPASCLPEFFERVIPRAMECGLADGVGFEDLQTHLPRLYLTKPTERFIKFGEQIAENFVQRAVEMCLVSDREGRPPYPEETRLPDRVVEAFHAWLNEAAGVIKYRSEARRPLRRPELYLDPHHGVRVLFPPQRVEAGERLFKWVVDLDSEGQAVFDVYLDPGRDMTFSEETLLTKPFSSLRTRLLADGNEIGAWTDLGVSRDAPFLFFHPGTFRLMTRRVLQSGPVGLAHLPSWEVHGQKGTETVEAGRIESLGAMPFGWSALEASVYDFEEFDALLLLDTEDQKSVSVSLAETGAFRPRLVESGGGQKSGRDDVEVFFSQAPCLEIWKSHHQTFEEFIGSWAMEIVPLIGTGGELDSRQISLADLSGVLESGQSDLWCRVPLGCGALLGDSPWGEFHLRVKGPIGQDAQFTFRVMPPIRLTREQIDWRDVSQPVRCQVSVPENAHLRGAEETEDPRVYSFISLGDPVCLRLEVEGYGGRQWDLPLDLHVPLPAWALYNPGSARHLVSWSREPLRLSLAELEGQNPTLLLRMETPLGIPSTCSLSLREPSRSLLRVPATVDSKGFGKVDLARVLSEAGKAGMLRLDLILEMELLRGIEIPCGQVSATWTPRDFDCREDRESVVFTWTEAVRVGGRAVRIESLLRPWDRARTLEVPDGVDGIWEQAAQEVFPCADRYRVTLGLLDPWSETFEPGESASRIVDHGSLEEWMKHALYSDPGPEGHLYRLCLRHATGEETDEGALPPMLAEDGKVFALDILRSRERLRTVRGVAGLVAGMDVLLGGLPLGEVCSSIASESDGFHPEMLLRARLFTRRWRLQRDSGEQTTESKFLPEEEAEKLWRVWRPLGLWADMQAVRFIPEAEHRILHYVGQEHMERLCPLQEGGLASFWTLDESYQLRTLVNAVGKDAERTPFEVMRVDPGVVLEMVCERPRELEGYRIAASRDFEGKWHFESLDEDQLPPLLAPLDGKDASGIGSFFRYPESAVPSDPYPGPPFIAMIRSGNASALESVRMHVPVLPSGVIGTQAFWDACFSWCLRAASDPSCREEISRLCANWGERFADDLHRMKRPKSSPMDWRLFEELRNRWFPNAVAEPLYGVHFVVGAVALALVWRGLRKWVPFSLHEHELEDLAISLHELTPELLEHDLMMTCALESLNASTRNHNEPGPGQADNGAD